MFDIRHYGKLCAFNQAAFREIAIRYIDVDPFSIKGVHFILEVN